MLRRIRCAPKVERLEDRIQPSGGVRSIDGTGNNLAHPNWGAAGVNLLRLAPAAYADGVAAPSGTDRPSARAISNAVADQSGVDIISDRFLSAMAYAWGQFVDHDLDLTPTASPTQSFPILVPTGDPSFDPAGTGTKTIPLSRSAYDPATGTTSPRQQINVITAWLDGSQIYGSDDTTAAKLRTFVGGRLKTSNGNLLPYNNNSTFPTGTLPMANDAHVVPDNQLFAAGDIRANENIELTALHTVFLREHNRLADQISRAHPRWNDEAVYQATRARVIAELQVITYREWLPTLLGTNAMSPYRGYNPSVNPGIANEFSTAAFRLGHSMLGDDVEFLSDDGLPVADEVPLSQAFFNPPLLTANGIDPILKYLASDPSSEIDTTVVDSVRNFLFGPPGSGGLDLVSLNIQRGRDHGLADYNSVRAAYGLPRVTRFADITSNGEVQDRLRALYGTVNRIDAWVGALAEDHVRGGSTGPLIRAVLVDQFERLRDGDRFWYQRIYVGRDLQELEDTTLADILRRNTTLSSLQNNVFVFEVSLRGTVFVDANRNGRQAPSERGLFGVKVDLIDATSGDIVASTTTDPQGDYRFDVLDGMRVGLYSIRATLDNGWVRTTPALPVVPVKQGDTFVRRLDIGVARAVQQPHGGNPSMVAWTLDAGLLSALFTPELTRRP